MRGFTVIRGGLAEAAPGEATAMPGRARLEAVGARLRLRLEALWRAGPEAAPLRMAATRRTPIPAQAFLGIRPEAGTPYSAPSPGPSPLRLVGAVA